MCRKCYSRKFVEIIAMAWFVFVAMAPPKEPSGVEVTLRNHGQVEVDEQRVFESLEIGLGEYQLLNNNNNKREER